MRSKVYKIKFLFLHLFLMFGLFSFHNAKAEEIQVTHKVNSDNSVDFFYTKVVPGSYTISIKFNRLDNGRNGNFQRVIKGKSGRLFSISAIDKNKIIQFNYVFSYVRGDMNAKIDREFAYLLPFKDESSISVREMTYLWNNYTDAKIPKDWKAYLFETAFIDTIYAARKGIVIEVIDNFSIDHDKLFASNHNRILIEHADGTVASYENSIKNGALVKLGDIVFANSPIAVFRNSKIESRLAFKLYYLKNPNFFSKVVETIATRKEMYGTITPLFLTTDGLVELKENIEYTVVVKSENIKAEMTRKEKKRFGNLQQ